MDQLIALYDRFYYVLGVVMLLIQIGLVVEVVLIHQRLSRTRQNYQRLLKDSEGQSLEKALETFMTRVEGTGKRVEDLGRDFLRLAEVVRGSVQHVGLIRFNPFADMGSDQSFCVALLDDYDNGVVITSLHNRASTRVYAKPIQKGQPVYPLSDEEKEAFETARRGGLNTKAQRT
ncbi:MAG: DUF4446 family protein [Chloroflexi bacterium]|nr:DUF4446 family protein [Chloroflexota bacterium]